MKFLKQPIVWLLTGWLALPCTAQHRFRHLTTRDGLIQGSVYYFLEDRYGYIWMSTQAGLNRFDGQVFKSYVHDDRDTASIGKGEVRGLAEAPNGDIWLGTEVGLSRYIRQKDRFENYYLKDERRNRILSHHQAIYADDSTVWFLNDTEGLVRMNYVSNQRKRFDTGTAFGYQFKIEMVHFDPAKQVIWLVQPLGVLRYEIGTGRKQYFFSGRPDDAFKEKRLVYSIISADNETFWLSTAEGLVELKGQKYSIHPIDHDMGSDPVFSMVMLPDGQLWLGTKKSGIVVYDTKRRVSSYLIGHHPLRAGSLAGPLIGKLFADSRHQVWANIDPLGVDLIFPDTLGLFRYEDDPLDPDDFNKVSVRGIAQDLQGNLWVGTSGEGLRRIAPDGTIKRFGAKEGFPQGSVRGVLVGSEGNIWISTLNGLYIRNTEKGGFRTVYFHGSDPAKYNYVKGVAEIAPGYYFTATMGGIFGYRHGRAKLLTDPAEGYTGALYFDKANGLLYAGRFEKNLRCYAFRADTLVSLYDALPGHSILSFLADTTVNGKPFLWIGTDNGWAQLDPVSRTVTKVFSVRDGLPDNVVYAAVRDGKGGIWISTNKGLARYTSEDGFQRLRSSEGIEFNSYAALKANDGRLYFGSTQGLIAFYPENLSKPSVSVLQVSGCWVSDTVFHPVESMETQGKRFAPSENDLAFGISALDFLSETPPQYEYRLYDSDGEGEWVSNGEASLVRFRNLPPDSYRLRFRVLDANGFYSESPILYFTIASPFWQQWWFLLILGFVFVGLMYLLVRQYVARQRDAQQKLTRRIIEAQESERLRIAMDIHDDVNNTLAAAKGRLQMAHGKDPEKLLYQMEQSGELIKKATEDLRHITHDLMPVEFEKYTLPDVLERRVSTWNEQDKVQFHYIVAGEYRRLRPEAELVIYRIVSELAQNIRKHSGAIQAVVQLVYQEKVLVVSVEDDGIGLGTSQKENKNANGIGLKNVYSRAEYLKAGVELSSDKKGLLVQILIPYDFNRNHTHTSGR